MQKRWVQLLLRQRVFVVLMLLLQVGLMVMMVYSSSQTYRWVYNLLNIMSLVVVLHVISTGTRASYKLLWSIVILLFPLFGGLMYLLIRLQGMTITLRNRLETAEKSLNLLLARNPEVQERFLKEYPEYAGQCRYLTKYCKFSLYEGETVTYLSPGEEKFKALLTVLEQAEKFIFLEYFIVQEGKMWNTILDVLVRKAKEGVDVRLIYDDMGCFMLLPHDYEKYLQKKGIRCVVFNKFRPVLSTLQNNRDHRKIAVIDGKWAFTGGINLADEYINEVRRFGHWKDASVMITGRAVESYTFMFLSMWQALTGEKAEAEKHFYVPKKAAWADGYVIPYCDSPIDSEYVGEQVYLNVINGAKKSLYIQTPYLIVDDSLISALILAAKKGVDVKILTPGIPDKWYVHMTTRSYYRELLSGGVQIFEYAPGFIHSKIMVADDTVATIGTVNLDCRSLYLHFECGMWLCGNSEIPVMKEDFLKTLKKCKQIKPSDCRVGFFRRLLQNLLRLFAPLM
ncbi:MAG: cardiolipin synthase [Clostridia bacterium]|nr:cardiolipin synthase [Clostridia bacterium]